ncbi:MAG: hypothetical protein K9N01_11575 [Cephaloticoccus sp.]|nr:hypothetical protein [Cephaloticoccus sp.]
MLLRALTIWCLIALVEVLQGVARVRLLNRRVGDHRARQIGVVTGSILILAIAWLTLPWLGATTQTELLGVGLLWMLLMLALDVAFGRWVFRFSWQRIVRDFDPRQGGWLSFGMVLLLYAPWLAAVLH